MDTPIFRDRHRDETLFVARMQQLRAADAVLAEAQERLRAVFAGEELASYPCDAADCGWLEDGRGAEVIAVLDCLRPDLTDEGEQVVSVAAGVMAEAEREAV